MGCDRSQCLHSRRFDVTVASQLGPKRTLAALVGKCAVDQQRRRGLERLVAGNFDGVIVAIVEETFVAADAPDSRISDDETLETGWGDESFHVSTLHRVDEVDNIDQVNVDSINP